MVTLIKKISSREVAIDWAIAEAETRLVPEGLDPMVAARVVRGISTESDSLTIIEAIRRHRGRFLSSLLDN